MVTIGDHVESGSVNVGVTVSDKTELLQVLLDSLAGREGIVDLKAVSEAVFEREAILSTGVGDGIALPHAKTSGATSIVTAFATMAPPVHFDSFDGKPAELAFMIVGPPTTAMEHVRIMGRMSRLLQRDDVKKELLAAESAGAIIEILRAAEEQIPSQ